MHMVYPRIILAITLPLPFLRLPSWSFPSSNSLSGPLCLHTTVAFWVFRPEYI
jgi:hypothetical protein